MWPGSQYSEPGMQGQLLNERQLTAAIRNATTAERLAQLADAHRLNPIHVAAILTKLANLSKKLPNQGKTPNSVYAVRTLQTRQQLVQQLQHQLSSQRCQGHCPRGLANIVWALAKLQCAPDLALVKMLLQGFCNQLPVAVPQDIANILWGVAQLTRDYGVSSMALGYSADDGEEDDELLGSEPDSPQHPDDDPSALQQQLQAGQQQQHLLQQPLLTAAQVHLLLQQLCTMLPLAASQTISNIAWAITVLQQCHNWCLCESLQQVRLLAGAFASSLHDALPRHVQRMVRCTTQLATACSNHSGMAWVEWQPSILQALLGHLLAQRKALKQYHVASVLKDVSQIGFLTLPPAVTADVTAAAAAAAKAAVAETQQLRQQQQAAAMATAGAGAAQQQQPVLDGAGEEDDDDEEDDAEALAGMADELALAGPALGSVQGGAGPAAAAAAVAAATGCTGRDLAAVAAHLAAVAAGLPPPSLAQPAASAPPRGLQQQGPGDEPLTPTGALVRQLVSDVFARLLQSQPEDAAAAAAASRGGAVVSAALEAAAGMPPADAAAAAAIAAKQQKAALSSRAAASVAASSAVLSRVLPQLGELGMLQQYNALRSLYPQYIPSFKPAEGHAVSFADSQQQQQGQLPPLVEFPPQQLGQLLAPPLGQGPGSSSGSGSFRGAPGPPQGFAGPPAFQRMGPAAAHQQHPGGMGVVMHQQQFVHGPYHQQQQQQQQQQQLHPMGMVPPPPPVPYHGRMQQQQQPQQQQPQQQQQMMMMASAPPPPHRQMLQQQQQVPLEQQQQHDLAAVPGSAATAAAASTTAAPAGSAGAAVGGGAAMAGASGGSGPEQQQQQQHLPQSPFESAAAAAAAAIGGGIGSGASQVTTTSSSGNHTIGTPSSSSMSSVASLSAMVRGDRSISYSSNASGGSSLVTSVPGPMHMSAPISASLAHLADRLTLGSLQSSASHGPALISGGSALSAAAGSAAAAAAAGGAEPGTPWLGSSQQQQQQQQQQHDYHHHQQQLVGGGSAPAADGFQDVVQAALPGAYAHRQHQQPHPRAPGFQPQEVLLQQHPQQQHGPAAGGGGIQGGLPVARSSSGMSATPVGSVTGSAMFLSAEGSMAAAAGEQHLHSSASLPYGRGGLGYDARAGSGGSQQQHALAASGIELPAVRVAAGPGLTSVASDPSGLQLQQQHQQQQQRHSAGGVPGMPGSGMETLGPGGSMWMASGAGRQQQLQLQQQQQVGTPPKSAGGMQLPAQQPPIIYLQSNGSQLPYFSLPDGTLVPVPQQQQVQQQQVQQQQVQQQQVLLQEQQSAPAAFAMQQQQLKPQVLPVSSGPAAMTLFYDTATGTTYAMQQQPSQGQQQHQPDYGYSVGAPVLQQQQQQQQQQHVLLEPQLTGGYALVPPDSGQPSSLAPFQQQQQVLQVQPQPGQQPSGAYALPGPGVASVQYLQGLQQVGPQLAPAAGVGGLFAGQHGSGGPSSTGGGAVNIVFDMGSNAQLLQYQQQMGSAAQQQQQQQHVQQPQEQQQVYYLQPGFQ